MRRRNNIRMEILSSRTMFLMVLGGLFLMGGLLGCFLGGNIHADGAQGLKEYLEGWFSLVQEQGISPGPGQVLPDRLRYPLLVFLLGFTAAGVIGVPVLFAMRGFAFVFPVACICRLYGGAGLLPGLVLFGLPGMLWIPALFILGMQSMSSSCELLRMRGKGRLFGIQREWLVCGGCFGTLILCALLECYVFPLLAASAVGAVS